MKRISPPLNEVEESPAVEVTPLPGQKDFLSSLFGISIDSLVSAMKAQQNTAGAKLSPLSTAVPPFLPRAEASGTGLSTSDRGVYTVDGDLPQINLLGSDLWLGRMEDDRLELLKYAAACSGSQQPQDVSRGFMVLHTLLRCMSQQYKDYANFRAPDYMEKLTAFLHKFAAPHLAKFKIDLLINFFRHLPQIILRAFTPKIIQDSYKKSGFYPYNARQIMSQCTEWDPLEEDEQERILKVIDELTGIVVRTGKITEADMDARDVPVNALPDDVAQAEIDAAPKVANSGKPLDDKHASHQRAMWLNNEGRIAVLAAEQEQRNKDKSEKRKTNSQASRYRTTQHTHKQHRTQTQHTPYTTPQIPQLKASCQLRQLSKTGSKGDLLQRLRAHEAARPLAAAPLAPRATNKRKRSQAPQSPSPHAPSSPAPNNHRHQPAALAAAPVLLPAASLALFPDSEVMAALTATDAAALAANAQLEIQAARRSRSGRMLKKPRNDY